MKIPASGHVPRVEVQDKDILDMMIEKCYRRRENWNTIEIQPLPGIRSFGESAILGTFSVLMLSSKARYILKPVLVSLDHTRDTPTSIARDYLMLKYKRGPIVSHKQILSFDKHQKPAPNYAKPQEFRDGAYIDIQATYWSLMKIFGWNVDYYPGMWLRPGTRPDDFPFPDNKLARNCLVSAGLSDLIPIYTYPHGMKRVKKGNPLMNRSLLTAINDVLNSIAARAVTMGAIYVNSDGYIAPNWETADNIIQEIKEWGLVPRIKAAGAGEVVGSGTYQVGAVRSALMKTREITKGVDTIRNPAYNEWLKRSVHHWSLKKP